MLKMIDSDADPDIIFLDINMKEIDGLTAAAVIRRRREDIPIVLVTSLINYAVEGYKVKANRFLVKDDLENTFTECMDSICLEILRKDKMMLFSCVEGDVRLTVAEIIFIETSGHKVVIHLEDQTYNIYEKLDNLEIQLQGFGFVRAHQSYLVNMRHIRNINSYILTLDNGKEISVPKARYKDVKQEYTLYVGRNV